MNTHLILSSLVYECMTILPFRILVFYPFRRQLRLPVWIMIAATCALQILQAAVYTYVIAANLPAQWSDYGFEMIFLAFLLCCLQTGRWQALFQYIFILDYNIAARGISRVLEAALFHGPRRHTDSLLNALVTLVIFAATALLVLWFLKRYSRWSKGIRAPFFWRTVWMLPAINTVIVLMYTNKITRDDIMKPQYLISRMLLFISMFLVYMILMRILDVIRRETVLKEQTARQEQFLAMERTRLEQLERHLLEIRQARHNSMQHLRIISGFVENNDIDALRDYIRQYEQLFPKDAPTVWCAHHAANVQISYYAGVCRANGINFSAKVQLPKQLPVADPDFCSVLGNLLENALTACMETTDAGPFIKVRASSDENQIVMTIDNTCSVPPKMEGDTFRSTKHEGAGIGTASVRSIARKYHGRADFHYQDHVFYASVLLFAPGTASVYPPPLV